MAQNPLQQAGSQDSKPTRFASLYSSRFFNGLWCQRNPLKDPSTKVESLYYGGRPEAIISGVNIELTNLLTLSRRPGTSKYSLQNVGESVNSFYSFKTFSTTSEKIQVLVDGLTQIYTVNPAAVTSIFTKANGAGQASFFGINNWLYFGDGAEERAWSGTGSTRKWGIATAGISLSSAYAGTGTSASSAGGSFAVGANGPTVAVDSGISGPLGGGEVWSSPANAKLPDGICATCFLSVDETGGTDDSNYLNVTGFNFNIPTGATVTGVWALASVGKSTVTGYSGGGTVTTESVKLLKANVQAGTQKSSATPYGNFIGPQYFGSTNDLWGTTLTPSDVNNSGFGIALATKFSGGSSRLGRANNALVDYIAVTVFYNTPPAAGWTNPTNIQGPATGSAANGAYATAIPSGDIQTVQLYATNYGFGASGTVTGIQVNITGHVSPIAADTVVYAQLQDNNGNALGFQKSLLMPSDAVVITNTVLTSNVATYTANNTFQSGQIITVTGTANGGGAYNVVEVPVLTASSTQFTIAITHADVGSAVDAGEADSILVFGGSTDSWGAVLNTAIINSSSFGVQIRVSGNGQTFALDACRVFVNTSSVSAAVSGSSGTFTAATGYQYGYAYANTSVSPPVFSNMSAPTTSTGAFSNKLNVGVTVIASPDTQVNTIWVFRTGDGGSTYQSLPTNPYPNSSTTITDSAADSTLNQFQLPAQKLQNTPPPAGIGGMVFHMGRMWGFVGNVLYFATGGDLGNILGNPYESWAPANNFVFPSKLTKIIPNSVGLLVFTISDVYIVYGTGSAAAAASGVSGITVFYPAPFIQNFGLLSQFAADVNGTTIYAHTADKQFLSLDPSSGISKIGFPVGAPCPAYPNDPTLASFNPANSYVSWHASNQDEAVHIADGNSGWFRCNTSQAPEGGVVWSPKANIIGGCQAVQSIETSPGIHQLLIGPNSQLMTPYLTVASTGTGSLAAGNYFIVITAIDAAGGQTNISNEVSATIGIGGNGSITLSYVCDPRSTSVRIYYGNVANGETNYVTTANLSTYTFTSTSGNVSAAPPNANTTFTAGGPILYRDTTVYADNGLTYPANFTMGSIVLAYPGQLAELGFITCDFNRVGTSPILSVLLNEISGAFESLSGYVHSDPPSLYGATGSPATLYSNRYDFEQTVSGGPPQPAWARHMQVKIDYGLLDGVRNELFTWTVFGCHYQER